MAEGGRQLDRWKESLISPYGAGDRQENCRWREGRRETGGRCGEERPTERERLKETYRRREAGRLAEGREPDSKATASDNGERERRRATEKEAERATGGESEKRRERRAERATSGESDERREQRAAARGASDGRDNGESDERQRRERRATEERATSDRGESDERQRRERRAREERATSDRGESDERQRKEETATEERTT